MLVHDLRSHVDVEGVPMPVNPKKKPNRVSRPSSILDHRKIRDPKDLKIQQEGSSSGVGGGDWNSSFEKDTFIFGYCLCYRMDLIADFMSKTFLTHY